MSDVERTEFSLPDGVELNSPLQRNQDMDATEQQGEHDIERSLRPKSLGEFIGQPKVREQLSLVLNGAKNRGVTPDHVLLSGPPGLGKTTMAMIIAQELGSSLRMTSGPALERAGDLAAMLSNLMEGDVLFIDEIHRIARPAEEMLYMAMEDFRIDVIVGKGPGATSIPLEIPPFTLVGATTRAGMLTGPLRDRFGFTAQMEYYDTEDLTQVITRAARILEVDIDQDAAVEIDLGRAELRELPTASCAASVTTPRSMGMVTSMLAQHKQRCGFLMWTNVGWTALTVRYSRLSLKGTAVAPWVSILWPSRWARSRRQWRRCASPTSCARG